MLKNSTLQSIEDRVHAEITPICVMEIELSQPLPILKAFDEKTGQRFRQALCLIRLHAEPLGTIEIPFVTACLAPEQYIPRIWNTFRTEIVDHLQQDGLPECLALKASGLSSTIMPACINTRKKFYAQAPFASVIVPTRDRPEQIRKCLDSLLNLYYPDYEIIVVDNAPATTATADIIQQEYSDCLQIQYVREDRPGLSSARNCGFTMARGDIIAFADDDLIIDPYWLIKIAQAFSITSDVVCVTGLIMPLELETPSQLWFEEFGRLEKGFKRCIFDQGGNFSRSPLYPYAAGHFGSGANMAFTRSFFQQVGGFDLALGTGRPSQGGEDLAILFQAVTTGHKVIYEPAALVYHPHCRNYTELQKKVYGYGVGLSAYLMKIVFDNPLLLLDIAIKVPYGLFFMLSPQSPKNSRKSASFPKELAVIEQKGVLHGLCAYLESRRGIK